MTTTTKIPLYSDTLFTYLIAFLFGVCFLSYLEFPTWAVLSAAAIASIPFATIAFLWMRARLEKRYLLKKDEAEKDKLMLHLALSLSEANRRLFIKLLKAEGKTVTRRNGALLTDKEEIHLLFSMSPISADEIALLIKKESALPKAVYGNTLSKEAEKLLNEFSIPFVGGRELYLRLKERELLPKEYVIKELPKPTVKEKFASFFRRSLAKPYFFSAVALLSYSFFTPYKIYYLAVGIFLLLLSLALRLVGKKG